MAGEIQLNSVTLATESSGTITLSSDVDTLTPIKTALNASGSAPIYACRAWVNFNGTGTVAIRASGNVSSITDNGGSGDYTVNFTTAMSDTNYAVMGSVSFIVGTEVFRGLFTNTTGSYNTSSARIYTGDATSLKDTVFVSVSVFR